MGEEKPPQSWWATVPGLLTAVAGTITALSGLLLALNQTGVFKPVGAEKTFLKPQWGDYRLDYCFTWAADCGSVAATAWCKAQGFAEAVRFEGPEQVGIQGTATTRLIGTNKLCAESFCSSFQNITCR